MLENLTHRGAVGADPLMGDGAGMLVQIPDALFRAEWAAGRRTCPGRATMPSAFLPAAGREPACAYRRDHRQRGGRAEGQELIGWRDVPVDNSSLSKAPDIAATEPVSPPGLHRKGNGDEASDAFERRLFILRKVISNRYRGPRRRDNGFYIVSLSSPDDRLQGHVPGLPARRLLHRPEATSGLTSALALVHQRFSTNTFPSWKLPTPTGWSRTTARSTRCAATSTGWRRARHRSLAAVRRRHGEAVADLL
jgi:glutamate synthase (NADPH/NADH) large chain